MCSRAVRVRSVHQPFPSPNSRIATSGANVEIWDESRSEPIKQFSWGQSNPTFALRWAHGREGLVVRKQPPGKLLKGAHDVGREYAAMYGPTVGDRVRLAKQTSKTHWHAVGAAGVISYGPDIDGEYTIKFDDDGKETGYVKRDVFAFEAKAFVDGTYEGTLMKLAGVSYTWGREANSTYNESAAGMRATTACAASRAMSGPISAACGSGSGIPGTRTG